MVAGRNAAPSSVLYFKPCVLTSRSGLLPQTSQNLRCYLRAHTALPRLSRFSSSVRRCRRRTPTRYWLTLGRSIGFHRTRAQPWLGQQDGLRC